MPENPVRFINQAAVDALRSEPDAAAAALAASAAGKAMAKRRLALLGPKGRRALASHAGKAQWKGVSAQARSLEMRRRYAVRRKRKAKEAIEAAAIEKQLKKRG
jgi:hypothetical protein